MKLKKLSVLIFAVAAMFAFVGCKNDDDDDWSWTSDIAGQWHCDNTLSKDETDIVSQEAPSEAGIAANSDGKYSYGINLILNKDGTGSISSTVDNVVRNVTWKNASENADYWDGEITFNSVTYSLYLHYYNNVIEKIEIASKGKPNTTASLFFYKM